ncbi:hypothetical protein, partial [Aureimonas sp. Leaf460]|uniref:hypothetical protein n=1 Tax=Aureimonas sp. Leaf460 TaxID=1736384 RepID=UPI00138F8163
GVPAIPITVEIGTAAEIVARLVTLTDQGNVSAVVLTDTNVLTIPTGQLAFFMRKAEAVLDKIQGTYS